MSHTGDKSLCQLYKHYSFTNKRYQGPIICFEGAKICCQGTNIFALCSRVAECFRSCCEELFSCSSIFDMSDPVNDIPVDNISGPFDGGTASLTNGSSVYGGSLSPSIVVTRSPTNGNSLSPPSLANEGAGDSSPSRSTSLRSAYSKMTRYLNYSGSPKPERENSGGYNGGSGECLLLFMPSLTHYNLHADIRNIRLNFNYDPVM